MKVVTLEMMICNTHLVFLPNRLSCNTTTNSKTWIEVSYIYYLLSNKLYYHTYREGPVKKMYILIELKVAEKIIY